MPDLEVLDHGVERLLNKIIEAGRFDLTYTVQNHPGAVPELTVEISGPDTQHIVARNAELLRAIEHLAFEIEGLEPDEHDLLAIDAGDYRRKRNQALELLAGNAVACVRETCRPHVFQPMSSHERRQLHLALATTGLRTASTGEGAFRAVVLYPDSPAWDTP